MNPIGKVCTKCGKKIYGLSEKDVKYKMLVHSLKHVEEIEREKEVDNGRNKKTK